MKLYEYAVVLDEKRDKDDEITDDSRLVVPITAVIAKNDELHQGADAVRSLRTLRDAWNAHMETCPQHAALPDLAAPTEDELRAWRDAPSNTASAHIPDDHIVPDGDQRCGYVMDACRCMKRKGHDGLHACAH